MNSWDERQWVEGHAWLNSSNLEVLSDQLG